VNTTTPFLLFESMVSKVVDSPVCKRMESPNWARSGITSPVWRGRGLLLDLISEDSLSRVTGVVLRVFAGFSEVGNGS